LGLKATVWLLIFCLLTGLFVRYYMARGKTPPPVVKKHNPTNLPPSKQTEKAAPPQIAGPVEAKDFVETKDLRVSDDEESKQADFWIEQYVDIPAAAAAMRTNLLDLYVSIDPATLKGVRVRLTGAEAILEKLDPDPSVLAKAPLANLNGGENVVGALWRRGELSVWLGSQLILKWTPPAPAPAFSGRSGAQVVGGGLKLGPRRTLALNAIRFDDSFMRDTNNGAWRPQSGRWELTALAFPERSANPFSLRATFGGDQPAIDPLYTDRLRDNEYGLGVMISQYEGTLHIARITGGSPAARAGLQEDDIFLEIDGAAVEEFDAWQVYQMLMRGFGGDVRLKMLRPGEKQPREFTITREQFRWGTPSEGTPIQPVKEAESLGGDRISLITGGEPGWSDYAAEVAVKPLGYGGFGLAFAVTSPQDFLLFRWRGPVDPSSQLATGKPALGETITDRLQLIRVAGGQEAVLAERTASYRPYEFYRLSIDWSGDKVKCFVDDNELLTTIVPELRRGQVGLYALRGLPVFFDDVRVAADRSALVAAHHPERALNDIFVFEDDMEAWANPALEWDRDLKTGWAVHASRFPGEQAAVLLKPKFKELTVQLLSSQNPDEATGPRLEIHGGEAVLRGQGFDEAKIKIGADIQRIALRGSASKAEAEIDGRKLSIKSAAPTISKNDRIAIRGLKNLGDPKTVRVTSENILEYTFNTSPTDWKVESGRWGLLNKWICDPRWSWFGGRSKTLAALWNKNVFSGDTSVDAFVALMMQRDDPPFERPGDYNITLCGDGVNLDSGYTLVFAGDNNSWTRLYRKGKLVAESTLEDHRIFGDRVRHPDKPELHQRWFHVKLEKIGNEVSFYRDGNLAFTFKDAEPLPDGRVAFWTIENGFLLSRVRIAHGGAKPAPFESRLATLYHDSQVINQYDGEVLTNVQRQSLPPAITDALASPRDAFKASEADALSPELAKSEAPAGAPNTPPAAYRVANGTGGGPFVLQWKSFLVDPEKKGILRFAYCIEPGTQVDLYLLDLNVSQEPATNEGFRNPRRVSNQRQYRAYRWRLTGPRESGESAPLVGEIPNVKADGRWHTVQFDLQPSWRALWKSRGYNRPGAFAGRMILGNLDNHGYLLAGMNGNHAGAAFSVSEITALSPAETDKTPPKAERAVWPYDDGGDGRSVQIFFNDAGGSGVAEESLQAEINGVAVPREMAEFDPVTQKLKIDLLRLNLPPLATGSVLNLKLLGFSDRAQNNSEGAFSASYTYDAEAAGKAAKRVAAPRVAIDIANNGEIVPGSAPLAFNEITQVPPMARLQDSTDAPPWAPAGNKRSVQVVNMYDGSAFGFALSNASYSVRHWPYIQLDYKIPFETPVNLHLYDQSGLTHAVLLTDVGDDRDPLSRDIATRAGPPADFVADGTWRRSIIPIEKLFDGQGMQAGLMDLRGISIHDNGWRGNRRGMEYWIHRIQPLAAGRFTDLRVTWQAADLSGIADFASLVDDKPETDPQGRKDIKSGETLDIAATRVPSVNALKDGWNFLHLRVKNNAGVWSEPIHSRFFVDTTAPKIARTEPVDGGKTSGQTLKVYLDEEHGVDLESLRLVVNGKLINPGWRGFEFDPGTRCITYRASQAGVPDSGWRNGDKVLCEVRGLKDLIGNRAEQPYSFSFTVDQAADVKGPAIARARFVLPVSDAQQHRQMAMETSFGLSFEEHTGHVHAMRDCKMEWLNDPAQVCFGKRALKFTALDDDADVQILLHKNAWYIDRAPMLHFDYKADPGFCVDLMVEVLGQWMSIRFTGDGSAPENGKAIGKVDAVAADGTWRHASVDLRRVIDQALPNLPIRIVDKIVLSAQGQPGCKRGATLTLDNMDLARSSGGGARVEWEAESDPSGIEGYYFAINQDPNGADRPLINCVAPNAPLAPRTGVWYAHIRANDQAGNWGPARTMRIDFGQ
jgi:hypothetical protein